MAQTDRDVLVAFFMATDGPNWNNKTKWGSGAPLSDWYGVTANDEGRVVKLSLCRNRLRGHIPQQLGQLNALESLILSDNKIFGAIPPELGNLAALLKLHLASTQMNGSIPPALGALGKLRILYLDHNNLTGDIPPQLGNMSALEKLDLGYNNLHGAIPARLGALNKLTRLDVSENQLCGPIPPEVGNLAGLRHLDLTRNQLSVLPRAVAEGLAARHVRISLSENPWKEPPPDVVRKGISFAAKYLKDLDDYGRTSSNRLKVVLVGLGNAGKTSVAIRLQGNDPDHLPIPEERTVGVEIRDIKLELGPANEGSGGSAELDVKLWDFAGQRAYYDTHQIFLTQDALFILVVDVFAYSDVNSRKDALEQWLDILQSRVPGSVVLIVGTHSDKFPSSAMLSERMQSVKRDVCEIMERICRDCDMVNETRGEGYTVDHERPGTNHEDCKPIRIVEKLMAFNLRSTDQEEIDALRNLVELVAYESHQGYHFPSVRRRDVPTTHALAVATLEAVRRGVHVAGSAGDQNEVLRRLSQGDPSKGRPFIKFSAAFALFVELWDNQESTSMVSWMLKALNLSGRRGAKATPALAELQEAFLRAVQLHEDRGAILLTGVDGDGQWDHSRGADAEAAVAAADLVIHVDPAWFANLVRRIVDIRLLDPAQQGSVLQALKYSSPASSMLALSTQHARFFQAGEVSRDYLKFLWLRDMKLGPASTAIPPLEMSEEDIDVMVDSLLDIRFMFRVRNEQGDVRPNLCVVASCLPDHAGCDVDPQDMLQLEVGGAIFSQELELVGAHAMPPGLIPRLLAWCGRGQGHIQACWKRGVCFDFNSYLVLVYEGWDASGAPSISCHAMGSAHDWKAGGALTEVIRELDRLMKDKVYGFRGVGLLSKGRTVKNRACSHDKLEEVLARLESALEDHLNVKFDELSRKSDIIAGCIRDHLHAAEERMRSFELNADANANVVDTELGKMRQEVFSKLDFIAAVTSKCLLVSVKGEVPCPRFIRVEEDASQAPTRSRFSHFRRAMMDPFLRKRGKSKGMESTPKCYRVRFLCAHDMSAADCGPDGQGYIVESEKKWQQWLRKCLPLVQVSLWLLRVGVSVVARADILPVDGVLGTLRDLAEEEAAAYIEAIDLNRVDARNGGLSAKAQEQVEVFGQAYADLVAFVAKEEDKIAAVTSQSGVRSTAASAAPVSTVAIRSFEKDMVLVSRQESSDEPLESAWVRRVNQEKWKNFESRDSAAQGTGSVPQKHFVHRCWGSR